MWNEPVVLFDDLRWHVRACAATIEKPLHALAAAENAAEAQVAKLDITLTSEFSLEAKLLGNTVKSLQYIDSTTHSSI